MLLNKKIPIGSFLKIIKVDLAIISAYAIVVGVLDQYSFLAKISIPLGVTGIIGTVLSLLLAFRVSQSYGRWWEACIVWGAIVNDCRTLIRQIVSFHKNSHDSDQAVIRDFAHRQIYWCYALSQSLRRQPFSSDVTSFLTRHSIRADHIPNALLSRHSTTLAKALEDGKINVQQQQQLDGTVHRLCDAMGQCERIKNTVFPKSYSVIIHFLIYVFATLLPLGLSDEYPLVEIALTIAIPSIFIAIEQISILMQDPFENQPLDTPMTALSQSIERNLREMIGDSKLSERANENNDYYVL